MESLNQATDYFLLELEEEGGIAARFARYTENQRRLVVGMEKLGFQNCTKQGR